MILPMIASIFLIIAIVCFLNLTPQQITQDLSSVVSKKPNIRDRARALRAGKKKKGLGAKLEYLQSALKACGKEGMFAFVCLIKTNKKYPKYIYKTSILVYNFPAVSRYKQEGKDVRNE